LDLGTGRKVIDDVDLRSWVLRRVGGLVEESKTNGARFCSLQSDRGDGER
jgi:hypothetical protein